MARKASILIAALIRVVILIFRTSSLFNYCSYQSRQQSQQINIHATGLVIQCHVLLKVVGGKGTHCSEAQRKRREQDHRTREKYRSIEHNGQSNNMRKKKNENRNVD